MRRLLSLLLVLFVGIGAAIAQQKSVSGHVTSMDGNETLPGVNVLVKEAPTVGTVTDINGNFEIKSLPTNAKTLIFRFVGFKSVEVPISGSVVNASLETDNKQVDEFVVTAYGSVKKSSMTSAAAVVNSKKLSERPVSNVLKAIEGQAAGVQVSSGLGAPGEAPVIRIRGFGSINAANDPLYVVDGIPYVGSISNLSNDDIENMTVLKDAAATALYGSRAANGVVIITTKKGHDDKFTVNAKATYGVSVRGIQEYSRVGVSDYYPLMWEGMRNGNSWGQTAYTNSNTWVGGQLPTGVLDAANLKATNELISVGVLYNILTLDGKTVMPNNQVVGTDGKLNSGASILPGYASDLNWEDAVSRLGKRGEYSVSASGGTKKSDYYFSLGYLDEHGYVIKSDYERLNARANINVNPKSWLKLGVNIGATSTSTNQVTGDADNSTSYKNPFYFVRNMGPIYPVHLHDATTGDYVLDANGNYQFDFGGSRGAGASVGRHVVAENLWDQSKYKTNIVDSKALAEIILPYGFKFAVNGGLYVRNYLASEYDNKVIGNGAPSGRLRKTNTISTSITMNELLTWIKNYGKHNFDVLAGHESYSYEYNYLYGAKQNQSVEGIFEFPNFSTISSLDSYTDKDRIESYISRVNYNYSEKYFLTGSYRRDGSSRFQKDARWGNFFSSSVAWIVSREDFMKNISWLDNLKLRASYGETGNNDLGSYYSYQTLYNLNNSNGLNSTAGTQQRTTIGNDKLSWETNKQSNIAVDFGVFRNISGSIEWFNRQSDNLLFNVPLPISNGVLYQPQNIGSMYNRGFEVSLTADILKDEKGVKWTSTFNATTFKNKITKMPLQTPTIISGTKQLAEGHSIYDYYLRLWGGVDPADGSALYVFDDGVDANGNAKYTFDASGKPYIYRTIDGKKYTTDPNYAKYDYCGTSIPDVFGGWTNTFNYMGVEVNVLLTYSLGGKTYDGAYASLMSYGYGSALHTDILDRWQKPGDITDVPRIDNNKNTLLNASSSRWLIKSDYLALKNISIGWNVPKRWLSKASISSLNVYFAGDNLGLICARKGMNPQAAFSGVTSNTYLPARIYTVGLNIVL